MLLQFFGLSLPHGHEWIRIIAVMFFVFLWVRTITEIFQSQMNFRTKAIWLLTVIFTTVLGLILYKIFDSVNSYKKIKQLE